MSQLMSPEDNGFMNQDLYTGSACSGHMHKTHANPDVIMDPHVDGRCKQQCC